MNASDESRFKELLAAVMLTYPNMEITPATVKAYWMALCDRMKIEEFEVSCRRLMVDDRKFPPRPRDFLDAARGDQTVEAHSWWERLTDFSRSGPYQYDPSGGGHYTLRERIPDRARFALEKVGGARRLASAKERDLDFVRQRFETAYATAANHEIVRPNRPLIQGRIGEEKAVGDVIQRALSNAGEDPHTPWSSEK